MLRFVQRNKISDDGVPLALISTDRMSVSNNISSFDLSYLIPENRLSRERELRLDGSIEYKYDAKRIKNMLLMNVVGLQSSNAVVTNKAAIRNDIEYPSPLYYKYRIGRGQKYLYKRPSKNSDEWRELLIKIKEIEDGSETTLSSSDVISYTAHIKNIVLDIRDNIYIATSRGTRVPVVFDIGTIKPVLIDTKSEYFGSVFDVTIYTSERCANDITLLVNYASYNIKEDSISPSFKEVMNAEPIHELYSTTYSDTDQLFTNDSDASTIITKKQYAVKFVIDE